MVFVAFQNKYGAQRALQRNGELVSRQLMVGVRLLDARMRSAALQLTDSAASGSTAPVTRQQPHPQPLRAYRIDAASSGSQVVSPLRYGSSMLPRIRCFSQLCVCLPELLQGFVACVRTCRACCHMLTGLHWRKCANISLVSDRRYSRERACPNVFMISAVNE